VGLDGAKSSAKGARIEAPTEYVEVGMRRGTPPPRSGLGLGKGLCPSPEKKFIFGSRNVYFGAFYGRSGCLLLHCNTFRSRPPIRLPSLIFQADYGSIKGAGVSAEEGTEHYLPFL